MKFYSKAPVVLTNAVRQELNRSSLPTVSARHQQQAGFTLIETILGVGLTMVLSMGSYMLYEHLSNNSDVRQEQDHIISMASQTEKAYTSLGSFEGLTTAQAISSHVVPNSMVNGTNLRSRWGSDVQLEPADVNGTPNNALKITYLAVPQKACSKLASATAQGAWDIEVNDVSVFDAQHSLDVARTTNLCADQDASKMEFTYYGSASGLAATVLAPVKLAPYVPPAPISPSAPPAPVPAAPPAITPPGVVTPPTAITPPSVPPVATTPTAPPPATPPGAPPSVGPSCVVPNPSSLTESANQTGTCPSGQVLASGASTFQQTRTRTNTYTCPDPWGTPVLNNGPWGAWTPATASICAPACVAPAPSSNTETQPGAPQSQTLGCAADQTGSIAQSRTVTQVRVATTTWSCPAPTGSATSSISYTGWSNSSYGAWQTTSNTCTPTAPPAIYAWVQRDRVYGPGSGCHLGSDQNNADNLVRQGVLLGYGQQPYRSYDVNRAAYPCNANTDGQTIGVYQSCGGWQAGLEGYSGFRCEALSGGETTMWQFLDSSTGAVVYNGPIANNPYPISQEFMKGGCSLGQTHTLSGYQWTFQNFQTMRGTVAIVNERYQCIPFSYPEY